MTTVQQRALRKYRQRLESKGLVRLEVVVTASDRSLVRRLAAALRDQGQDRARLRQALRRLLGGEGVGRRKALLEAAPLEDVPLERIRETGRPVTL